MINNYKEGLRESTSTETKIQLNPVCCEPIDMFSKKKCKTNSEIGFVGVKKAADIVLLLDVTCTTIQQTSRISLYRSSFIITKNTANKTKQNNDKNNSKVNNTNRHTHTRDNRNYGFGYGIYKP